MLYPEAFPHAVGPARPSAGWLARVVAEERAELLDPEPLYLRRPDAVVRRGRAQAPSSWARLIRPATPDDLAALAALERDAFGADAWDERGPAGRAGRARAAGASWPGRRRSRATPSRMTLGDVVDLQRIAVRPRPPTRRARPPRCSTTCSPTPGRGGPDAAGGERAQRGGAARSTPRTASRGSTARPRYYRDGSDALVLQRHPRHGDRRRGQWRHDATQPLVLGIETSCDETGVGIVRGHTLLADAVASSVDEHARFGGVVPEVASRAHLEAMVPTSSGPARRRRRARDVDAIAVTSGPGLAGALLVGVAAAKALAVGPRQAAVRRQPPRLPRRGGPARARAAAGAVPGAAGLAAATPRLLRVEDVTRGVEPLGATIDDAAGEAFDKVARLLGLPFPGGPHIDRAAASGDSVAIDFPRGLTARPRPRAAPLRLLLLRAQDRRGPLGGGPAARRASRCRSTTSRRPSRRPCATC